MISPTRLPSFRSILPFSIFLSVTGWLGTLLVVLNTLPTLGPRWLFFFFIDLALTGTSLPLIFYLNIRFPSYPPIGVPVVIRQACWVGVYGGIIAWLQLGRILTTGLGVAIAIGLVVVEWLIRFREKSRGKPSRQAHDQQKDEEDDLEDGE